jgi:hypothetical protein
MGMLLVVSLAGNVFMERLEILKTRAKSTAMSGLLSLFCVSLILACVAIAQDKGEQWERPNLTGSRCWRY